MEYILNLDYDDVFFSRNLVYSEEKRMEFSNWLYDNIKIKSGDCSFEDSRILLYGYRDYPRGRMIVFYDDKGVERAVVRFDDKTERTMIRLSLDDDM